MPRHAMNDMLPRGQQVRSDFPRFGLNHFAHRFPKEIESSKLIVSGDLLQEASLENPLAGLTRIEQTSDFHCVTTWSTKNLHWSGVRFAEFYEVHIAPKLTNGHEVSVVVLGGQDGYQTTLLLSDLLADDVLLADTLNGTPLTIAHGAPLRLIAPRHYGYKSMKHLSRIEFWQEEPNAKPAAFALMDHPRARVDFEERGRWLPGWVFRLAYRPLIEATATRFAKAMALEISRASRSQG